MYARIDINDENQRHRDPVRLLCRGVEAYENVQNGIVKKLNSELGSEAAILRLITNQIEITKDHALSRYF